MFAVLGDSVTTAKVSWGQPNLDTCREWLGRRIENEAGLGYSFWGVERLDRIGLVVGLCGYFPHDNELELGYVIRADYWGHGYATEAARAVLGASRLLGQDVYATIRSTNAASLGVARKIGLVGHGETTEDERGGLLVFRRP